ncbi:SMI1/KNR4 family protein [Kineosporia babensis]|uniref:SMI1/KNR4 family protein n=1 Tax=Kineosporia babensis TaxID=499548 RepID=A0A9X1ND91_9ACTN|nr:hypothetical protein [Kineosporia babensis]MCD5311121.1 hypothetical protein [Kineosporia babensis]
MVLGAELVTRIDQAVSLYGPGRPIPEQELRERLSGIGLEPDPEYAAFVGRWGGCYVGVPVHAWDHASTLGRETCVDLTLRARANFGEVIDGLVFAEDGSGNPLWIGADRAVHLSDHDGGPQIRQIASSFSALLSENVHDESSTTFG